MKKVELEAMSATALRTLIGGTGISRTPKAELVKLAVAKLAVKAPKAKKVLGSTEVKVNKSDLLRREIRRRARAQETLNSGDLMKFMEAKHEITMSRQFVVNVRNRFTTANPELLKA